MCQPAEVIFHRTACEDAPRTNPQQILDDVSKKCCNRSQSCDVKLLARGSTSVVWKYQNLRTGQSFAVKGPRSPHFREACVSPAGVEDARMLEDLRHKHVVEHRQACADGSMIMEYIDGGSLLEVMERAGGTLGELQVANLTGQCLSGLDFLHSKNIIHRDIKPANVFFDVESSIAKIGDIATAAESASASRKGVVTPVGTPSFLAPEVVRTGVHAQASDVWAVGCTVLQLLTGKLPWHEEDNAFAAMFKIGSGLHPPIPAELSPTAKSFLLACFAPQQDRPSAAELLSHPFVADRPPTGPL